MPLLPGVLVLLLLGPVGAEEVQRALGQAYGRADLQRTWPPLVEAPEDGQAAGAGRREREREVAREGPAPPPRSARAPDMPAWMAGLSRALLWVGAVVFLVLVGVALVNHLARRRLAAEDVAEETPGSRPSVVLPPQPMADAQRLAAQGRYGEAIHVLLLGTLAALSSREALAPSLTSREIAARIDLGPEPREALAGLVRAVESSLFAQEPADVRAWEDCADRHRRLARALGPSR